MITAYIDFKSLDCFLAISPILELADDCETPVSWKPYRSTERALPTQVANCLLYTSPSPRDEVLSRMPSSA